MAAWVEGGGGEGVTLNKVLYWETLSQGSNSYPFYQNGTPFIYLGSVPDYL